MQAHSHRDRRGGIRAAAAAINMLFDGKNTGKLVVKL